MLFQREPQSFALSSKVEMSGGLVCEVLSLMAAGQLCLGLGSTHREVRATNRMLLALLHLNAARPLLALTPNSLSVWSFCATSKEIEDIWLQQSV